MTKKKNYVDVKECSYNPVYATSSDLKHPVILRTAFLNEIISQDRYMSFINSSEDVSLEPQELSGVLEKLFGFCKGNYEEEVVDGEQRTIITGDIVKGEKRYMGVERLDKEWVESGMASDIVKETYKWGGEVTL